MASFSITNKYKREREKKGISLITDGWGNHKFIQSRRNWFNSEIRMSHSRPIKEDQSQHPYKRGKMSHRSTTGSEHTTSAILISNHFMTSSPKFGQSCNSSLLNLTGVTVPPMDEDPLPPLLPEIGRAHV